MFRHEDDDKITCPHCGESYYPEIGPPGHLCSAGLRASSRARRKPVRSHPVPRVGDTVRLNREGLQRIYGTTAGLSHMLTKEMLITHVDAESMTEPEQTFLVKTNDREINQFWIDHWMFDVVPGKRSYTGPMPR